MNTRHWISLSLIVPIGLALGAASSRFVDPVMKNRVDEPYQLGSDGQPALQYEPYRQPEPRSYPLDTTHPGPMAAWVPPPLDYYTSDNDDFATVSADDSSADPFRAEDTDLALAREARKAGDAARDVAQASGLNAPPVTVSAGAAEPRSVDSPLPAIW